MTKLSVNINKVATIRNARGGNNPDILKVAQDCESFGADGITVHPRPDERHIRYADVVKTGKLAVVGIYGDETGKLFLVNYNGLKGKDALGYSLPDVNAEYFL